MNFNPKLLPEMLENQITYIHGERELRLAKEIWYTYGIIKFQQDLHGKKPESNLS